MGRFDKRRILTNSSEFYDEFLKDRGVNRIKHLSTPEMSYPTAKELAGVSSITHVWTTGDRFYKLAHKHYGDSTLWWVIAWFNRKPTEAHVSVGDVIKIPSPLQEVYRLLKS